ncbi:MAG: phosphatase PAP2 family protein [Planctomycetota bacterium]
MQLFNPPADYAEEPTPVMPRKPIPSPWRMYAVLVLLAMGGWALVIDIPVARWAREMDHPRLVRDLFDKAEPFGHGLGVVLILAGIWILDAPRRWVVPRVALCAAISGLLADIVKLLVGRQRPYEFDLTQSPLASFVDWAPLWNSTSGIQSFPSGHAATAAGFAVGLAWAYPRGRWYFYTLAVLVACHRVEAGVHYVSDVCCGASLALLSTGLIFDWGLLPGWLDRLEARIRSRLAGSSAQACVDDDQFATEREAA